MIKWFRMRRAQRAIDYLKEHGFIKIVGQETEQGKVINIFDFDETAETLMEYLLENKKAGGIETEDQTQFINSITALVDADLIHGAS